MMQRSIGEADVQAEIGRRLRAARTVRGLSLPAAAELMGGGIRAATLASYERGQRAVSAAGLVEIAAGYGISPCHLFPGAHTTNPVEALEVLRQLVEQQVPGVEQVEQPVPGEAS